MVSIGSHVNENEKIRKNLKIENVEKTNKKMVWIYGAEGATYKIWPGSMQRFLRNLSLRMDDGLRDDGRLRHDSSSADKVKQS